MYLLVLVVGFSLEHALDSPLSRRLADNNEPCKESCDEGHDRECDQQDDRGRWTISCDLHPTTSCDADCNPFPSPPNAPWLGASGTYPSPPPSPPPPAQEILVLAWIYFAVAVAVFVCVGLCALYRTHGYAADEEQRGMRDQVAYWCCCFLPCLRETDSHWNQEQRHAVRESGAKAPLPAVMLK